MELHELHYERRDRIENADAIVDDAEYIREAINAEEITLDQALMALLIVELRELNRR